MSLKTNYKDDIFSGQRKYRLIANTDGTTSLLDATEYTQQGDYWAANDANATNAKINALEDVKTLTLHANAWNGADAPFSQTVSVPGIRVTDKPILVSKLQDGADTATAKAYNKAFGCIASGTGTTADGSVTFKVYKKPTIDIMVGLKGV